MPCQVSAQSVVANSWPLAQASWARVKVGVRHNVASTQNIRALLMHPPGQNEIKNGNCIYMTYANANAIRFYAFIVYLRWARGADRRSWLIALTLERKRRGICYRLRRHYSRGGLEVPVHF